MFKPEVSLDAAKQELFHEVKLIGNSGEEQPGVSSPVVPCELPNLRANLCDTELRKAQALIYWQMSNRRYRTNLIGNTLDYSFFLAPISRCA